MELNDKSRLPQAEMQQLDNYQRANYRWKIEQVIIDHSPEGKERRKEPKTLQADMNHDDAVKMKRELESKNEEKVFQGKIRFKLLRDFQQERQNRKASPNLMPSDANLLAMQKQLAEQAEIIKQLQSKGKKKEPSAPKGNE